jgi:hypothetical protein
MSLAIRLLHLLPTGIATVHVHADDACVANRDALIRAGITLANCVDTPIQSNDLLSAPLRPLESYMRKTCMDREVK